MEDVKAVIKAGTLFWWLQQKKRRKRKKLMPKNFDPENPGPAPDPERWLPKWQRSSNKKRRRRKDEHMKGSQVCGQLCGG